MKNFKLYSILFILSFFLFTCEDGGENVKEKDKFTTIHDKTYWSDGETGGDYPWSEGWYITKDQINIYYEETYDGEVYKHCEKIPLKDGIFTDQDGYEHLLNILVNNQDTLTLQFANAGTTTINDESYWGAGEMDFVVRGNLLKVTVHYLEENGTFDSDDWGSYTKTDDSERPTEACPYDIGG